MIIGIGIDLVDVVRISDQINRNSGFVEKVFTKSEIEYCNIQFNKAEHYAARFAAKEAFLKALGMGIYESITFLDIEVANEESGRPIILLNANLKEVFKDRGIKHIHLSMSHIKAYAQAMVILEA